MRVSGKKRVGMPAVGASAVFRGKHKEQGRLTIKASETCVLLIRLVFGALFLCCHFIPFYDLVKTFTGLSLCLFWKETEQTSLESARWWRMSQSSCSAWEAVQWSHRGHGCIAQLLFHHSPAAWPASSYWTPLCLSFLTHQMVIMIPTRYAGKTKHRVGQK